MVVRHGLLRRTIGFALLCEVPILLALYATSGDPEKIREGVFYLPFGLAIAAIVTFLSAAILSRWRLAYWSGIALVSAALGMPVATHAPYVIGPMGAKRARSAVLPAATQASEPDHLVEVMSGWGWHAFIAQREDGDVVAIRDFYRHSGWDYSRPTQTWRRIDGVPLADELRPTGPYELVLVVLIAAGLTGSLYARSKTRNESRL